MNEKRPPALFTEYRDGRVYLVYHGFGAYQEPKPKIRGRIIYAVTNKVDEILVQIFYRIANADNFGGVLLRNLGLMDALVVKSIEDSIFTFSQIMDQSGDLGTEQERIQQRKEKISKWSFGVQICRLSAALTPRGAEAEAIEKINGFIQRITTNFGSTDMTFTLSATRGYERDALDAFFPISNRKGKKRKSRKREEEEEIEHSNAPKRAYEEEGVEKKKRKDVQFVVWGTQLCGMLIDRLVIHATDMKWERYNHIILMFHAEYKRNIARKFLEDNSLILDPSAHGWESIRILYYIPDEIRSPDEPEFMTIASEYDDGEEDFDVREPRSHYYFVVTDEMGTMAPGGVSPLQLYEKKYLHDAVSLLNHRAEMKKLWTEIQEREANGKFRLWAPLPVKTHTRCSGCGCSSIRSSSLPPLSGEK
jgi:hypothetical protein